jgi:F-type H+-transporting ATPase subunit b
LALKEREEGIQTALNSAEEARKEIAETNTKVDHMLKEGKLERDKLLKLARAEAVEYRQAQQLKIDEQMHLQLSTATEEIAQQKRAAVGELKNMVAELSIEIAEKILKKELENRDQHTSLIRDSIENLEVK